MTVSDYLEADHRRLDATLPLVESLIERCEFAQAAAQFADFSSGLGRHIDAEERVLFPAFEDGTGMRGGPTQVMRAEHVEIRECMSRVAAALAASNDAEARRGLNLLKDVLTSHNMKEEQILYPMTDEVTPDEERDALVRQMQSILAAPLPA